MLGIYQDIKICASPERMMAAVTTPEGFNSWWTLRCSGRLLVGEVYNFYFDDDYDWYAYVGEYLPGTKVTYDMIKTSPDWENTTLSFTIVKTQDGGHLLRFEHTGWTALTDNFRVTSYCWANYLNNLKKYLEEGVRTPYTPK